MGCDELIARVQGVGVGVAGLPRAEGETFDCAQGRLLRILHAREMRGWSWSMGFPLEANWRLGDQEFLPSAALGTGSGPAALARNDKGNSWSAGRAEGERVELPI